MIQVRHYRYTTKYDDLTLAVNGSENKLKDPLMVAAVRMPNRFPVNRCWSKSQDVAYVYVLSDGVYWFRRVWSNGRQRKSKKPLDLLPLHFRRILIPLHFHRYDAGPLDMYCTTGHGFPLLPLREGSISRVCRKGVEARDEIVVYICGNIRRAKYTSLTYSRIFSGLSWRGMFIIRFLNMYNTGLNKVRFFVIYDFFWVVVYETYEKEGIGEYFKRFLGIILLIRGIK